MKIASLQLVNFQGIGALQIDFGGHSAAIYGDNGTGKTTVFNAVTWLLFDKPSTGAKNWSPKTRDAEGEKHNLEHSATATFIRQDGSRVTLGKTLHEVYKKKRGSMTAEYTGNTVDYYLDGVPVKEKEYTAAVSEYCGGDEMMKLLTMPDYFPEVMEWKKRRELLLEICGDVTDDAVIESSEELADLPTYLLKPGTLGQYYTVEEYSKIARARKADINKQLESIPNRIDEAQRAIPENLPTRAQAEAKIAAAAGVVKTYQEELQQIEAAGEAAITAELAAARADLSRERAKYAERSAEATAAGYEAIATVEKDLREAQREREDAEAEAGVKDRLIERMKINRENILAEYREAQAVKWDESTETCPTCGRRLPDDKIEAMREEFNQQRSERLAAINARGKAEASKDMIAAAEQEAAELRKKAEAAAARVEELKAGIEAIRAGMNTPPAFETTEEYKKLADRIAEIEARAKNVESEKAMTVAAANNKLQDALTREHEARGVMFQIDAAERQRGRIAELEAQEKQLAAEYENVERGVYLCEQFTKAKVSLLTDRINSKFKSVSFQLFVEQVNGGLSECCEVLVPSDGGAMVPYATANHAARVNAGLEIIDTVAAHYGQEMPVFVDNAESVTRLADTGGQVIRLVVSEGEKDLRVEVA